VAELKYMAPSTVRRILKKQNIELRQAGGMRRNVSHAALQRAEYLYINLQWSSREIAKFEGLSPDTIINRLKLAGVQIRTRSESYRLKKLRTIGPDKLVEMI
jgi:hypothetical protein